MGIETEPPEEKNGEEDDEDVGSAASRRRSFCEEHLHGDGWIRI